MTLILASGSASRARVLRAAGVPFVAFPSEIDEEKLKTELVARRDEPANIAAALAKAKAVEISKIHRDALVLGADQILTFDAELISKCADMAAARSLLCRLRARTHCLISALALAQSGKVLWEYSETATLRMRAFSDDFLDDYLSTEGQVLLTGVGCYRLEGMGVQLFDSIEGDYFAILGLPLQPLLAELRSRGAIAR